MPLWSEFQLTSNRLDFQPCVGDLGLPGGCGRAHMDSRVDHNEGPANVTRFIPLHLASIKTALLSLVLLGNS